MKSFEELTPFEKKKMFLNEMGYEYIRHNSELNQKPFQIGNEGYFVLKEFLEKPHYYILKINTLFYGNAYSNVLPKNSFNPNSNWNDLYKVIDFMLNKELFEDEDGNKIRNYFDFFKVINNITWLSLNTIESTFEVTSKYFYNRINNINEN
jgi:hypothetical protein